jgi:putative toxin-antitoxin system antitoxin component (TIGR02293 family)
MTTTVLAPEVEASPSALRATSESVAELAPAKTLASLDWKAVGEGIPLAALEEFAAFSAIAMKDLLEVVIPPRTLKHRRQRKEPLNLDESDRLARVARVYELAVRVYGNKEDATEWLVTTKQRFEGRTALSMLRTTLGTMAVEEFLIQIDEGYFL